MRWRRRGVIRLGTVIGRLTALELHPLQVASRRRGRGRGWHGPCIAQRGIDGQRLRVGNAGAHALASPFIRVALVGDSHETGRTGRGGREGVGSIQGGSGAGLGGHGMRRLGQMRRDWCLQGMMMMQGRVLGGLGGASDGGTFQAALLRFLHDRIGARLVRGVIQQASDIMHEHGVQQIGDFFFVGEFQGSFKWNPGPVRMVLRYKNKKTGRDLPNTLQVHRTDFDDMTDLFAFQDTITTTTSHAGDIEQFGAVDHVVVFPAGHTDALGLDLVAKTTLVFP